MQRSPEQEAFRQALMTSSASILLEAVAGSGKTTTILDSLDVLKGTTALTAFNKKIAEELQARVNRKFAGNQLAGLAINVGTMHSFGLRAIKAGGVRCQVQSGKVNFLLKDMLDNREWDDPLVRSKHIIRALVGNAKAQGFGVQSLDGKEHFPSIDDKDAWRAILDHFLYDAEIEQIWGERRLEQGREEIVRMATAILKQSNQKRSQIDFDDMLYFPLLWNFEFQKFNNVVIDEAQDTNIVRREMAFRMLKPGGRLIIVGDPHQAIYGFTGADANALYNMATRADAKTMPLSVCWRCDDRIIEHAHGWVQHIVSHNAGSGAGSVTEVPFGEDFFAALQPRDAILCRLNRPNVAVAIALLRRGKTPRIEGRDLGAQLLKHCKLANPDVPDLETIKYDLDAYLQHQTAKLIERERHAAADFLADEVEAVQLLIDRCLEQGKQQFFQLEELCNELFMDDASKTNAIVLSSVHKAKGLEWPRVYLLGRKDYMPFWRAQAEWELEQERNLIYVAITRAEHELIEVTGVQSALDTGAHRKIGAPTKPAEPIDGGTLRHVPAFLQNTASLPAPSDEDIIKGVKL